MPTTALKRGGAYIFLKDFDKAEKKICLRGAPFNYFPINNHFNY